MTADAAGLRVSEVVRLKLADIDSSRMLIRIDQGKGGRDRYIMLSPQLLVVLRERLGAVRSTPHQERDRGPIYPLHRHPPVALREGAQSRSQPAM